jgi:cob(I)alamin adenosyltransferase
MKAEESEARQATDSGKLSRGLVQVYTGAGKGKTTAALGLAWRAMGRGLRVYFAQFLKGQMKTGEWLVADVFGERLTYVQMAMALGQGRQSLPGKPWWTQPPTEQERAAAQELLAGVQSALIGGEYDLVVCDEINVACHLGLVAVDEVLALIQNKPPTVELVLTGRDANPDVIAAADLVTEMTLVKHPFQDGVRARKGIEY